MVVGSTTRAKTPNRPARLLVLLRREQSLNRLNAKPAVEWLGPRTGFHRLRINVRAQAPPKVHSEPIDRRPLRTRRWHACPPAAARDKGPSCVQGRETHSRLGENCTRFDNPSRRLQCTRLAQGWQPRAALPQHPSPSALRGARQRPWRLVSLCFRIACPAMA